MIKKNVFSSLCFFTNFVHLINKNNYYCFSFLLLLISSIFYHQTKDEFILIFDKLFTYNIIITGAIFLYMRNKIDIYLILTLILFLFNVYLYIGGYYFSSCSFDKDLDIAENYHAFLHLTASIGHHIIISCI